MALWTKKSAHPANAAPGLSEIPLSEHNAPASAQVVDPTHPPDPTAPNASGLTQDQQRQAALTSKMMMAAYGEVVSVLSRSPQHRNNSLADLEWMAAPAVMTGQFSLAEAQMKGSVLIAPIGLVMWAHVSTEVDQRLAGNIANAVRLKPDEWRSGDILWLVDAVGDNRVIEAMLKRLVATEWKGREARMRARTKDGTFKVGVIAAASNEVA